MRIHARTAVAAATVGLALTLGCSAEPGEGVGSDVANDTEAVDLLLDNVFLEHADPAYWEPGDPRYRFPVAARIFYGYRPFEGVEMDLSGPCSGHVAAQTEGDDRDATITLWCAPDGDESKAFAFTTASQSYGQEEDAFDIVRGTSFEFIDTVTLKRLDELRWQLDVEAPTNSE